MKSTKTSMEEKWFIVYFLLSQKQDKRKRTIHVSFFSKAKI